MSSLFHPRVYCGAYFVYLPVIHILYGPWWQKLLFDVFFGMLNSISTRRRR